MLGRFLRWSLLLFVLLALLGQTVRADDPVEDPAEADVDAGDDLDVEDEDEEEFEEYEEEEEDEDDLLYYDFMPHPDIEAKFIFPDAVDNKLEIGKPATLLVVVTNVGGDVFSVREIAGHLHSLYDYTYYIQNYTVAAPNVNLGPDMEITLKYVFTPHQSLEPLDFWFSAHINYNNSEMDKIFRTTVVNGTIGLYESDASFSTADASIYVILGGLVGLVGLTLVNKFKKPSHAPRQSDAAAAAAAVASGWGASATKTESRPVRRRKSSSKKKRSGKKHQD